MQIFRLQVEFTMEEEGYPPYRSALYFPLEEWPVTQARINELKDQYFDEYKAAIDAAQNAPQEEPTPPEEE